jgi:hypothetical protein
MGFPLCQCSNCLPDKATWLMSRIKKINNLNMDDYVLRGDASTLPDPVIKKKNTRKKPEKYPMLPSYIANFTQQLLECGRQFLAIHLKSSCFMRPEDLFGLTQAKNLMQNFKNIETEEQCRCEIGGLFVSGLATEILRKINQLKESATYRSHIARVTKKEEEDNLVKTPNFRLTKDDVIRKNAIKASRAADQAEIEKTLLALQRNLKRAPDGTDQPIQRKRSTAAAKASALIIDPNLLHIL